MIDPKNAYCVIMSGGVGSRFWPYSRWELPKQFLDFFGTGRSLLQQTFDRFSKIIPAEHILLVTNEMYANLVQQQLPQLNPTQILLEPCRRNTAPCIAWASHHIKAMNPNASMVVAPADQLILQETEFLECIKNGLTHVAEHDILLTVGIKPNRPETAYGYIQIADELQDNIYKVKTFTEKPEVELARMFVESGEFYWNSGLFLWNVKTILETFKEKLPEIYTKLDAPEGTYNSSREQQFINEHLPSCANVSIDLGIMEKASNVYVTLGDFGWSDLGSWNWLYELSPKDVDGNATLNGRSQLYNCDDNMIVIPKDKLAVVSGLHDYLIAEADNVLMICPKSEAKNMRRFVNDVQLKFGEDFM